jgi:hypothetical protein
MGISKKDSTVQNICKQCETMILPEKQLNNVAKYLKICYILDAGSDTMNYNILTILHKYGKLPELSGKLPELSGKLPELTGDYNTFSYILAAKIKMIRKLIDYSHDGDVYTIGMITIMRHHSRCFKYLHDIGNMPICSSMYDIALNSKSYDCVELLNQFECDRSELLVGLEDVMNSMSLNDTNEREHNNTSKRPCL